MKDRRSGHALQRLPLDEGGFQWWCECGTDLGRLSVHKAREAHREHKVALDAVTIDSGA